jgi:hypothetical protein
MWESAATHEKCNRSKEREKRKGERKREYIANRIDDRMRPQETKRQVKEFGVRYANALAL